jgi:perosamine synthetase
MARSPSPHPRYRLYTSAAGYTMPLKQLLNCLPDSANASTRLETEICRRFNVRAACCIPMARSGVFFGLRELIKPGQKVIMSPLTIVDVVNMVILAGGIPVFADICRNSCAIDPEQAESLIDGNTGAVLITHLHGETAGAHEFRDICCRRGVPLMEDAAQAFGASENERRLGTIGNLGIYSFGFYKNLNAWCGGMLVSEDEDLIGRIRRNMNSEPALASWRLMAVALMGLVTDLATWPPLFANLVYPILRQSWLGGIAIVNRRLDPEYGATRLGALPAAYLCRMSPAQSTLALDRLDRIDADTASRVANAARYHQALAPLDMLITPQWQDGTSNIYTYYPIQYQEREALLRFAIQRRRDLAPQYLRNCADLPAFKEFYRDCPNARAAARELILLPTYPRYPESEIQRNIEVIKRFFSLKQSRE